MLFNANGHHGLMLSAAGGDHSFPERHFGSRDYSAEWTDSRDDVEASGLDATNHWVESTDMIAPKMGTLEPAFSTIFPQNWMDQAALSLHRSQNHANLKLPASSPHAAPAHDLFTQETTSSPVHQTELDMLWSQGLAIRSPSDFVWVPHGNTQSQIHPQQTTTSSRGEDDESDSMWSLNDSLEDYFQHNHPASWQRLGHPSHHTERFRRRSVPRVTKPGVVAHAPHQQHSLRHNPQIFPGGRRGVVRTTSRFTGTTTGAMVTPTNASTATSLKQHQDNYTTKAPRRVSPQSPNSDEEDDSSRLLSKKIAHKLSEKTRRNRLTMAIREIEKLLPPTNSCTGTDSHEEEGRIQFIPGGNAVSKVEVVEMAIGYIKRLRDENQRMSKKIERAEAKGKGKRVDLTRSKEETGKTVTKEFETEVVILDCGSDGETDNEGTGGDRGQDVDVREGENGDESKAE